MFCYKCGAEIPDESEFCMKCGTKMSLNNFDDKLPELNKEFITEPFEYDKGSDKVKVTKNQIIFKCHGFFAISTNHEIPYDKIGKVERLYKGNTLKITYLLNNKFKVCEFYCKDITVANKIFEICNYYSNHNNYNVPESLQAEKSNITQSNVIVNEIHKEKPLTKHQRIKENKKNGVACCPKCGSTSLSANKKGFGIGKAVIGAAVVSNPIGLVAGNINAKKVRVTCLNCGHDFWAGK